MCIRDRPEIVAPSSTSVVMLNSSFVTVELGVGFGVVGEMVEFGVAGDAVLPGKWPLHEAKELRMTNSDNIETFLELFIDTIPF